MSTRLASLMMVCALVFALPIATRADGLDNNEVVFSGTATSASVNGTGPGTVIVRSAHGLGAAVAQGQARGLDGVRHDGSGHLPPMSRRFQCSATAPSSSSNPLARAYPDPFYSDAGREEVTPNTAVIERTAERYGLDPDLVKAIVWMESTHGWWDEDIARLRGTKVKSIRPMNVYADIWGGLGFGRDALDDPKTNIEVGVYLLAEIWQRTRDPTAEKVATLYNRLGQGTVSDYGKTVDHYYRTKPWQQRAR